MDGPRLIRVNENYLSLKRANSDNNWRGNVSLVNINGKTVAVKIKSNNPSQYIVQPSSIFLSPGQQSIISFTRNNHKLHSIESDKFQFIAVEYQGEQPSSGKVDESFFRSAKDNSQQKIILHILLEDEVINTNKFRSSVRGQGSENSQIQQYDSPSHLLQRDAFKSGLSHNSFTENKLSQVQMGSISVSSGKNLMSPQFTRSKVGTVDKEKIYKSEYERLIQKVHEYEKNFQQLDQEIKATNQEREKWNQIQNAHKIAAKKQTGYEYWQVVLIVLAFMFLGAIAAK